MLYYNKWRLCLVTNIISFFFKDQPTYSSQNGHPEKRAHQEKKTKEKYNGDGKRMRGLRSLGGWYGWREGRINGGKWETFGVCCHCWVLCLILLPCGRLHLIPLSLLVRHTWWLKDKQGCIYHSGSWSWCWTYLICNLLAPKVSEACLEVSNTCLQRAKPGF